MKKIIKPDVNNTDPEYWEEVLSSHGLGLRQLDMQEPEEPVEEEIETDEEA